MPDRAQPASDCVGQRAWVGFISTTDRFTLRGLLTLSGLSQHVLFQPILSLRFPLFASPRRPNLGRPFSFTQQLAIIDTLWPDHAQWTPLPDTNPFASIAGEHFIHGPRPGPVATASHRKRHPHRLQSSLESCPFLANSRSRSTTAREHLRPPRRHRPCHHVQVRSEDTDLPKPGTIVTDTDLLHASVP